MKRNLIKLISFLAVIASIYGILQSYSLSEYFARENIPTIKENINSFGLIAPLVYIALYTVATIVFLPGLPITMLSGIAFGPIWGVVYASIGSLSGISCAFLIARYLTRGMVEAWIESNSQFQQIDERVKRQGWRMLMISRLVPIFPFNLQNYAYGLTKIKFSTFLLVSWICMLPGTAAYVQLGAAVNVGEGNVKKTLLYLAASGLFIILVLHIFPLIRRHQSGEM